VTDYSPIPDGFDLNRLTVEKRLGGSLFYEVWLVNLVQGEHIRTFALKSIHPDLATETARQRIRHEGHLLDSLLYPGVVRCHASGTFSNEPALLLDYHPLRPFVTPDSRLAVIYSWAQDLLETLDHLHTHAPAAPVVHGDIRAANLRLDADGRVVMIDFGSAVSRDLQPPPALGTHPKLARASRLAGAYPVPQDDLCAVGTLVLSWLESYVPLDDEKNLHARIIDWTRELRQERLQSAKDAGERLCALI
jgi:serine/threonine-protein kinase